MKKTISTLHQLFEVLSKIQRIAWIQQQERWKPSNRALETWKMLYGQLPPLEEKEISSLFQDSGAVSVDFSGRGKVLYLPPLKKNPEFVPVLMLRCNLDENGTEIRLRIMLYSYGVDVGTFHGIGFRLESPEGEGKGRHDFYHAQLLRSLGQGPSVECPSWLPETQPSFPLIADCPITLMLCMLLSLYGKKYCWSFVTEYQIFQLKEHLDRLEDWIQ